MVATGFVFGASQFLVNEKRARPLLKELLPYMEQIDPIPSSLPKLGGGW